MKLSCLWSGRELRLLGTCMAQSSQERPTILGSIQGDPAAHKGRKGCMTKGVLCVVGVAGRAGIRRREVQL